MHPNEPSQKQDQDNTHRTLAMRARTTTLLRKTHSNAVLQESASVHAQGGRQGAREEERAEDEREHKANNRGEGGQRGREQGTDELPVCSTQERGKGGEEGQGAVERPGLSRPRRREARRRGEDRAYSSLAQTSCSSTSSAIGSSDRTARMSAASGTTAV